MAVAYQFNPFTGTLDVVVKPGVVTVAANCLVADAVSNCVKVTGAAVAGLYQVATSDVTDPSPTPAIGIIISKSSPTECVVQLSGRMQGVYSGLVAGRTYFINTAGTLDLAPPIPSIAGVAYVQAMATAISDDEVMLRPARPVKTGGPWPFNYKSILFDGVDEYLQLIGPSNLTGTTPFTVSCWFKTPNLNIFRQLVSNSFPINASGQWDYSLLMSSNGRIYWRLKDAGGTVINALTVGAWDDGAWHLAVGSWDGVNISIDIDGGAEIVTAACANRFGTGTQFSIGAFINYTGIFGAAPFPGNIDEVAYWDVEFTPAQRVELYNAGVPTKLTTHSAAADLLSWWRMGDAPGDSTNTANPAARVYDVAGSNDVTPVNTEGADIVLDVP